MNNIEFPVVSDENSVYPKNIEDSLCPICLENNIGNGNEKAYIHGGALLLEERSNGVEVANLADNLEGFLFLDWDGKDNQSADFELALNVKKGQYSINFCSTVCLRKFLNQCVDNLENNIQKAKNA